MSCRALANPVLDVNGSSDGASRLAMHWPRMETNERWLPR